MAYSTSSPPAMMVARIGGSIPTIWSYTSTDAFTTVRVSGYITNAAALGMQKGDIVFVTKTDASPISCQIALVSAINADGSADLSDGVAITATNSD